MALSALFEIDPGTAVFGAAGVAQDVAIAGATVICRLASATGVVSVLWEIFGTHGIAAPTILNSTSTQMSFPVAAGDSQAMGIRCTVRDAAGNTDIRTSAVYVVSGSGRRPFFVGEKFERDSTYAVAPDLNKLDNGPYAGTKIYSGQVTLTGGVGVTNAVLHAHSLTGNGEVFVKVEVCAVDSAGGSAAIYSLYRTYTVTGGGNPTGNLISSPISVEDDAAWNAFLTNSGANIILQLTPDATNNIKFLYTLWITEVDVPA